MAVTTLFALVIVASSTGEKRVIINQTQLIKVPEGSNLTLQCQTDPEINLTNFNLDWRRMDIPPDSDRFVYSRRGGTDYLVEQMQRYKNRAELIKEDLTRGRMTLLIPTVQQSDTGRFKCFIPKLNVSFVFNIVVTVTKREDVAMTTSPGYGTMNPTVSVTKMTTKREDVATTTSPGYGVMSPAVSGPVEKRNHWIILGVCICFLLVLVLGFIIGVLVKNRGTGICKKRRRRTDEENQLEMGRLRRGDEGDKDEAVTTENGVGHLQQGQL
ncbi:selection and upkeep of intraepithelial T-cells protein 6-like isoform X3 [Mugil cephalus]|uniref:selection and upkeep of intraepithelial T-cells protein 6-like isoform X3 n=1 Tax=Mugil cephalus TaxID=48193 RepID=UPI001FB74B72|nr:selection and upkeep of intraepithelial T-cells protein 6-like isoform X3 [Mugil cephalus]